MSTWEKTTSFPGMPKEPFHLSLMGVSHCDGSYRIKRGKCPLFVFEYVTGGRGFLNIAGKHFEPCKDDVYIVRGWQPHAYGSSADNPWTKTWFNVEGGLVESLLDLYKMRDVYLVRNAGEDVLSVFTRAQAEIEGNLPQAQTIAACAIHEITARLAAKLEPPPETPPSPEAADLRLFIDKNHRSSLSLEDIAARAGKSPSQTMRIFRKAWGVSPCHYLADRKIESAKLLLRNTGQKVRDIAFALGFEDEYYFSTVFKKKTGMSPKHFRENEV